MIEDKTGETPERVGKSEPAPPAPPLDPMERHQRYWPETFQPVLMPLLFALQRANGAKLNRAETILARHGLSIYEFDVLMSLRRSPFPYELTPSDLQQSLIITSGGLTKILQQLEVRALVERRIDPRDRRVKPVALKSTALPLLEAAFRDLIQALEDWYHSVLTVSEMMELTRLLKKLYVGDQAQSASTEN